MAKLKTGKKEWGRRTTSEVAKTDRGMGGMGSMGVEGPSGGVDPEPETWGHELFLSLLQDLAAVTREKRRAYAALLPKPCT
eukprot:12937431-Prorocentrum_lima.AAC.1